MLRTAAQFVTRILPAQLRSFSNIELALPATLTPRAVLLISLVVCAAIISWQLAWRTKADPESLYIFLSLFVFQDYPAAWLMIAIGFLALYRPVGQLGWKAAEFCGTYPVFISVGTTLLLAIASISVYHAHPLSMDEYAAVFQSEVFAAGRLTGEVPPEFVDWVVPRAFQGMFLHVSDISGAIASSYWPGFALYLTPFTLIGAPWLANPVLGGFTVLITHRLGIELFKSEKWAGCAVLLTLASPAVTISAISFYSMQAHLLLNALYALLLFNSTPQRLFLAGVIGSFALVLHNPVPHALFALPWIVWLLRDSTRWSKIGVLCLGYVPVLLVLGLGWPILLHGLSGAPGVDQVVISDGFALEWSERLATIFHIPTPLLFETRLMGLAKLWLWATPALLVPVVLAGPAIRADKRLFLFAASIVVTFIGYLFVPFDQGHGWGFRYLHSAWIALPLLAVAGLRAKDESDLPRPFANYVCAAAVVSVFAMTALRMFQVDSFIARHLDQMPQEGARGETVVFLWTQSMYYGADLVQNDPFLRDGRMVMLSRGNERDAEFMGTYFPEFERVSRAVAGTVWKRRTAAAAAPPQ